MNRVNHANMISAFCLICDEEKKKIGCLFAYLQAKIDSIDSNTKFNHLYAYYKILISLFLNI